MATTFKKLKKFSEELRIEDIAHILLLKANRNNNNCELDLEEIQDGKKSASYLTSDLIDEIKKMNKNYIIYKVFNDYDNNIINNIDSLIELFNNQDIKIKRKYLKLDYYAVDILVETKLLEIIDNEKEYHKQFLKLSTEMINFIDERKTLSYEGTPDEQYTWHFSDLNKDIIDLLLEKTSVK
jgi:hypothetical protein